MNLVRGVGRLLLGGFFIVNGVRAVKDPAHLAAAAEPIAQRFVPLARRTLPPEAATYVPDDTETLVRVNGVLSVLGGLGMATGIGRRGGAGLAAVSMVPHVLAANPKTAGAADKDARRSLFVRNLALLGAALVVSQDTAGQPSLAWRAADARKRVAKGTERAAKAVTAEASHTGQLLAKDARRLKREAQLQARLARKSIEGALP
ncbi:MAG: DoxX family protein [Actinomycetes bacterium]